MRQINFIVLHCTATSQNAKPESILRYWKTLGWKNPGYHYLIEADGKVHNLQPIEKLANGVAGHNSDSIHISYVGGIDNTGKPVDNRKPKQVLEQLRLIIELKEKFPAAKVVGHTDFDNVSKACPSFSVAEWLKHVGFKN